MRLHKFSIDEKTGSRYFLHRRWFWHVYDDQENSLVDLGVEAVIQRPKNDHNISFEVGGLSSETPFDGCFKLFGNAVYWKIGGNQKLNKIAEKLTKSVDNHYTGREFSIIAYDWHNVFVKLWALKSDYYGKKKLPKWRDFSFSYDLVEKVFGPKRYSYEKLATEEVEIVMPEGTYPAVLTLEECTFKRTNSNKVLDKHLMVDVDVPKGIPSHYDKSGGWKGDRTYGYSVKLKNGTEFHPDWYIDGLALATGWVHNSRGKSGFRKAQED